MIGLLFLIAAAPPSSIKPVTVRELHAQAGRCGTVFNVDAAPPGDGVLLSDDGRTIILSTIRTRPGIRCMANWAKRRGLQIRYRKY
jgi:hypothetical protein